MEIPPDYFETFKRQMESIAIYTEATSKLIPKELAKLSKQLGESFDAYPESGRASRPGEGAYQYQSHLDESAARAALYARSQGRDEDPMLGGGRGGGGGGLGRSWRDRVNMSNESMSWLHFPGTQMTAVDYFDFLSVSTANLAQKRQTKKDQKVQREKLEEMYSTAKDIGLVDAEGNMHEDVQAAIVDEAGKARAPDTRIGKVSDFFAQSKQAYIQGRTVKNMVSDIMRPVQHMQQTGYGLGASGGSPGFMGFHNPLSDPGVEIGLAQQKAKWGMIFGQQVSPGQAGTIMDNLNQRGWVQGQSAEDMRRAAADMTRFNPAIGQSPAYYDMMDKATRQGTVSLQDFNRTMMQVPDASHAAHVSIQQTMTDMDQLGQLNKSMGGTYAAGTQNAAQWQSATGLPSSVMGTLMQNPMVKGRTFLSTGLMPFEQGLASPSQHMDAILDSMNQMSGAVNLPGIPGKKIGGFSTKGVTPQQRNEAWLAERYHISPEVAHTMMTNQKGFRQGMQIQDKATAYADTVSGQSGKAALHTLGGKGPGTFGEIQGDLAGAVDTKGHKMFENWTQYAKYKKLGMSDAQAHSYAQLYARGAVEHAGDKEISQAMKDAHGDLGKINKIKRGELSDDVMHKIAKDRADEIGKQVGQNTDRWGGKDGGTGPKLQIELGPAAKKMFHLSDPNSKAKADKNAGAVDVNTNSYAGGATAPPTPDPLTSGSGSANIPPQYQTGSGGY